VIFDCDGVLGDSKRIAVKVGVQPGGNVACGLIA
jgi:beta-phosphoglucomutase-like phosphatase (HAD superfamily)